MNRKDLTLGAVCLTLALWALWPCWLDARFVPANYGDLYTYHYPMRHLAVESLQRGRLPFWNPYIFSGIPLAANPQSVLFYPVTVLAYFWPLSLSLSWDILFHLVWAMLGMALLARACRLPAAAAWTLALIYGLCPFTLYRVAEGIPTLLASLAWAPWCWLAWLSGRRGWLAAVWALQFFSGHPQFLIVNAAGMALWAAFRPRAFPGLAREAAWALALAFAQVAMTFQFAGLSVRRSWPEAYALAYNLEPAALRSLLHPALSGTPWAGTFVGPPSVFFETFGLWIGAVGLAGAFFGLRGAARKGALLALAGAGLLLAAGARGPLGRAALWGPLAALRTPSRWLLLCLWALLLAAGGGLARARRSRGLAAAAFLFAALDLCLWGGHYLGAQSVMEYMKPSAMFSAKFAGANRRLITDPELPNPNKTSLYHARNANGYEAFYLDGYPQYAARSEGRPAADASRTYLSTLGTPEMNRLSVQWKVSQRGLEETPHPEPLAYFVDAGGHTREPFPFVSRAEPERWTARGNWPRGAVRLVVAQPAYPGWRAWLETNPVALGKWDGLLQSIERPAGIADGASAAVQLRFAPTGWPWLLLTTLAAWVLWLRRAERAA